MNALMRRRGMMASTSKEDDKGWTDGVKYDWLTGLVPNVYILTSNGKEASYSGWSASDYLPCHGAKRLVRGLFMSMYNAFYDENKRFIRSFSLGGDYPEAAVPKNAFYFRVSDTTTKMKSHDRYLIPYSE